MPHEPANQNNTTPNKTRFPFFVKPGVLATRLVSASKSFLTTMSGGGSSPITGLETGSGMFSGYRPTNANYTNIPISRFQTANEYLGAYASIAAVYTCVNTIANSIAGLPTDFVDQTGKTIATLGQKEAEDDSLAGLLETPNPYQDWYALKETIVAHLELCGNSLVLMDNMDGLGRPANLYPLNPAYIQLAVSPDNGLLGYIYQPGGTSKIYYSLDEILHFKMANPSSPLFWGQGTLQALAGNLNTEIDILDSVNALYRNGAVIPGAFVSKEQLSDTEFTRLKNQMIQEHTGSGNFFKPLLLDAGLDWKSMSVGHTDLGTTEIRKMNREEIYMGFGVPVSEAGNQGRANVKNDHLTDVYWLTTIGPKVHRLEQGFKKLTKRYDPRYSIKMPLPVKVAEAEMLDNVAKVDGLTSLAVSEKRKAIKTITGDQFGWGNIPDEMPVEAGDPNAPLDPNAPQAGQLPAPDGEGEAEGASPDDLPLADAVKAAGFTPDELQNLVDRGILEPDYLDLAGAKGLGKLATKLGYTRPGAGVRAVKKPGSRGGHIWTDAHGNTRYGPQPTDHHASGGATVKKPTAHKKPANATGPKPKKQPLKNPDGTTFRKQTPARKLAQQKKKLRELDKVFKDGKDPHGNPLDAATLDHVSFLATSLRTDLHGKSLDDFDYEDFEEDDEELSVEDYKAIVWEDFNGKALDLEEDFATDIEEVLANSLDEFLTALDLDQPDQQSKGLGVSLGIQKLGEILINKLSQAAVPHLTQAVIAGYLDATLNNLAPSSGTVAKEAKSRAAQMADAVWQNTKEAIQGVTESGKSRQDQAKEIRNLFDKERAALIAGTETVSALNYGKKSGFEATGQKSQMWVTRRDQRVRHTHARADGQISETTFEVGGYKLKYPGDPDAPAKERVRCRCTLTAVPD
jgi:HK97 family phage portal protein